jgi:hypothetical protein
MSMFTAQSIPSGLTGLILQYITLEFRRGYAVWG